MIYIYSFNYRTNLIYCKHIFHSLQYFLLIYILISIGRVLGRYLLAYKVYRPKIWKIIGIGQSFGNATCLIVTLLFAFKFFIWWYSIYPLTKENILLLNPHLFRWNPLYVSMLCRAIIFNINYSRMNLLVKINDRKMCISMMNI